LRAAAPVRIAFVGDSTVQQVFYAFACELDRANALDTSLWTSDGAEYHKSETINQPGGVSASFFFSRFLRNDLPCAPWCTNSTMEACGACDVIGQSYAPVVDAQLQRAMETRPHALILGVGSWYNYHKGLYDSDAEFYKTLVMVRRALLHGSNTTTAFWYDIPNCGASCDRARRPEPAYEWGGISAKNDVARRTLEGAAHFLNVSGAIQSRLAADRIWPDGGPTDGMPHYCNPGHSSIPQFVAHVVLALLHDSTTSRHMAPQSPPRASP
jgi:hypothetical protein